MAEGDVTEENVVDMLLRTFVRDAGQVLTVEGMPDSAFPEWAEGWWAGIQVPAPDDEQCHLGETIIGNMGLKSLEERGSEVTAKCPYCKAIVAARWNAERGGYVVDSHQKKEVSVGG